MSLALHWSHGAPARSAGKNKVRKAGVGSEEQLGTQTGKELELDDCGETGGDWEGWVLQQLHPPVLCWRWGTGSGGQARTEVGEGRAGDTPEQKTLKRRTAGLLREGGPCPECLGHHIESRAQFEGEEQVGHRY